MSDEERLTAVKEKVRNHFTTPSTESFLNLKCWIECAELILNRR